MLEESISKSPSPIKKVLEKVDHQELKSLGFWLNQVFVVVATVLGVYLAAQSGLEQAIKFDNYNKMESNYYLRTSLYGELKDNLESVKAYQKLLARSPTLTELEYNKPQMSDYIWETMKRSSSTFETPSQFLTDVRRFYSKSNFIVEASLNRDIPAAFGAKQLKPLIENIENNTLPQLKESAEQLKVVLVRDGIISNPQPAK